MVLNGMLFLNFKNVMKNILFYILFIGWGCANAQTTAERYTVSSGGESVSVGANNYMYDIGGVVVTTATTTNGFVSQGFEQSSKSIDLTDFTPPNTFSPNDDGVNDGWVIALPTTTNITMNVTIINRWGDRVAYIENYNNLDRIWNGNYETSGEPVTDGTYFYIIESSDLTIKLSGWLQVVR
jgi:gliding motility-associated-like protein